MLRSALLLLALAAAPVHAAAENPCTSAPAALRAVAAAAEPDKAKKALRLVTTGERLCAAGGRGEAAKKFAAAAKALDTDMAALTSAETVSQ